MEAKEVLDELKAILVSRLKFDPRRVAELTMETPLPKGIDGAIGLDSLDFIELSIAVEERFLVPIDAWPRAARSRRRQCQVSASSMPPPTAPTMSAVSRRSS